MLNVSSTHFSHGKNSAEREHTLKRGTPTTDVFPIFSVDGTCLERGNPIAFSYPGKQSSTLRRNKGGKGYPVIRNNAAPFPPSINPHSFRP